MTIRTSPWPAGAPCWADLTVPDVEAATAFYSGVLGWAFPEPVEGPGGYAVAQVREAAAAAVGPLQPGAASAWTLYFASDDADRSADAVQAHGGTILLPPGDVGPMGRLLVGADPTGAVFGVWQAGTRIGAQITSEPGALTWQDLRTPDPDRARAFYTGVFGYRTAAVAGAPHDYTTIALADGDAPCGGIGPMMGVADGRPAHWVLYFGVDDTPGAVAAAVRAGGSVLAPQVDTAFGAMAGLADPDGAVFWVVQTTTQGPGDH